MIQEPSKQQIEDWKIKSEKWDNLGKKIERYYLDDDGNVRDNNDPKFQDGLAGIGEAAAMAFGWL